MTKATTKEQLLKNSGYSYNFDRELYLNRKLKKAFSVEFIEDRSEEEIEKALQEPGIRALAFLFQRLAFTRGRERTGKPFGIMPDRTVEDQLREEYFELLPEIRRVLEHMEAEVKYRLLPIFRKLDKFERLEVSSRIKECESAVEALRRRQQGAIFYPNPVEPYTLTSLKDLAGVRVLVFPRSRIGDVDLILRGVEAFSQWLADPVRDDGKILALKYSGYFNDASRQIRGEYQIVSVLTGLFWNIEHSAIYKPSPQLKGVARSLAMQERTKDVLEALRAFEEEFERLVSEGGS